MSSAVTGEGTVFTKSIKVGTVATAGVSSGGRGSTEPGENGGLMVGRSQELWITKFWCCSEV